MSFVSLVAGVALAAETEKPSLRGEGSERGLTGTSVHYVPPPPLYLDSFIPCQRHVTDGKCGFWSLTGGWHCGCAAFFKPACIGRFRLPAPVAAAIDSSAL
jgi:hypothetical protein